LVPDVALFVDSTWTYLPGSPLGESPVFERMATFLESVTAEANELAHGILAAGNQPTGQAGILGSGGDV
jgi:hypothetical protein